MVAVLAEEFHDYQLTFSQLMTLMAAALQRLVHIVALFEVSEMPPLLETYPLRPDQQLHIPYPFHEGSRPLKQKKGKRRLCYFSRLEVRSGESFTKAGISKCSQMK
jgi:hypothetical protein